MSWFLKLWLKIRRHLRARHDCLNCCHYGGNLWLPCTGEQACWRKYFWSKPTGWEAKDKRAVFQKHLDLSLHQFCTIFRKNKNGK